VSAGPFSAWERAVAVRYLRSRKGEAGLSVIAIISFIAFTVAVFALITVMSVMNGFRTELYERTLGFNGHVFVAGPALNGNIDPMLARLRAVPGVAQVQPLIESQALVQGPIGAAGAIVRGIRPEDLARTRIITEHLDPRNALAPFGRGENGGNIVIVGSRLAEALGVRPGDQISITSPSGGATAFGALPMRVTYIVGGTFTAGMSEFDQAFIYMPIQQAQLLFGRDGSYDVVEMKLDDPDQATRLHLRIQETAGPGTVVTDWTQRNRAYFNALNIERNVMRLILGILVLLAGLLILSSLIMLVKIKARDVAILRTMGASRGSILRIFFMTGSAIGIAGTLCGFILGVLFCANIEAIQTGIESLFHVQLFSSDIYFLNHVPARIEWPEVAIITLWSLAAAFTFTLWPAYDASSLDPVEALRYE
jgi:lipoprotein-releasing system permease protein